MAKVVVIDVNLGINLDDLILESAKDLTTNAKEELDGVISAAKAVQSLKVKKTLVKCYLAHMMLLYHLRAFRISKTKLFLYSIGLLLNKEVNLKKLINYDLCERFPWNIYHGLS